VLGISGLIPRRRGGGNGRSYSYSYSCSCSVPMDLHRGEWRDLHPAGLTQRRKARNAGQPIPHAVYASLLRASPFGVHRSRPLDSSRSWRLRVKHTGRRSPVAVRSRRRATLAAPTLAPNRITNGGCGRVGRGRGSWWGRLRARWARGWGVGIRPA